MATMLLMGMGETTMTDVKMTAEDSQMSAPATPASGIARMFTPEVRAWQGEIVVWAREWGLDANLVATVMQIESCGYQLATSKSGALGLFQVMPYHFEAGESGFRADSNAQRGLGYLKKALEAFGGDVRMALAGYNGGINGAGRPESEWSDEMQRYVYWGENIYREAKKGLENSVYIQEWLTAGGDHLCNQAQAALGGKD